MTSSAPQQTIPVVNLKDWTEGDPARRAEFTKTLSFALHEFGFVAVEGHGVHAELLQSCYDSYAEFFSKDLDVKKNYEQPQIGRQRGYTSFGVERAKDHAQPDLKEFWHFGRSEEDGVALSDELPRNVWPEEVPQLEHDSKALFNAMEECSNALLASLSTILGQEESFLPELTRGGNSIVRVIHYPACEGFDMPGAMRAAAHEDINLITLLPAATDGGLEILTKQGEWMPIHSIPGQIIVDTGDMMKRITNDTIPAITHRVVNPPGEGSKRSRYSMPFFVHPHMDAQLEVLETCVSGENPAKYEPIGAQDFLVQRLKANGVA